MPLIYLQHPRHGAKIATLELEAEQDEQNGWRRYNPHAADDAADAPQENALRDRRRSRRAAVEVTEGA